MADSNKPIDIDTMSDEDFMKINPSDIQQYVPPKEDEEEVIDTDEDTSEGDGEGESEDDSESKDSDGKGDSDEGDSSGSDDDDSESVDDKSKKPEIPPVVDPKDKDKDKTESDKDQKKVSDPAKGKDEKPADTHDLQKPKDKDKKDGDEQPLKTDAKSTLDFFTKVTAPFKADGRDMQVRTPEDVVRLMQMGVNYSRRMKEMKPLRAQDHMLKSNGLNDPEKLNFLIDLSKGDKGAIKKLLQDHKIDPVDIDTSSEDTPYQAKNYQGDPKDLAFDDAIKETIAQEGGRDLISDINTNWDTTSKEALRDQPTIFANILAQKKSGVYGKIKDELNYQRTMGYLTEVPFLQAYHQVGEAMQKAGVFNSKEDQVQPEVKKPLGTGTRKAAPKPKTEQPNPNVSSASTPRSVVSNDSGRNNEPDYASMSDEDFLKLVPPS